MNYSSSNQILSIQNAGLTIRDCSFSNIATDSKITSSQTRITNTSFYEQSNTVLCIKCRGITYREDFP